MTHNRCAYAPCAATLRPDGPSLYFCDETCQRGWNEAQQSRPTSLPGGPVRDMTPTLVAVDEIANIPDHAWTATAALFGEPARITDDPAEAVSSVRALVYETSWPDPTPRRTHWLRRAFLGGHR